MSKYIGIKVKFVDYLGDDVHGKLLPREKRILINARKPRTEHIFTLLHEIGHFLVHVKKTHTLRNPRFLEIHWKSERLANFFSKVRRGVRFFRNRQSGKEARTMQARANGITYLRWSKDSPACAPDALAFSAAAVSSISFSSISACSSLRERSKETRAASFLPRRKSQRGDSATRKLPMTNGMPGGSDTQKMLRQAVSWNANSRAASPSLATAATRKLEHFHKSYSVLGV